MWCGWVLYVLLGSGEFSRFTEWQGSEIMWHVATMLPLGEGAQQIARKRHIGNDICILVFLDGTSDLSAPAMSK
jgi:RAP1 GTPase activating protein 1